ncbi:MAG: HNH endonuclease [Pseudobdellovibrionaceae bacterium]|nr:HNH endonuclease [Bdellovibrionales bacterium]USN48438.1 MAG: HNH endonuclease [Pseudobdellovibrionaceae bacterium]
MGFKNLREAKRSLNIKEFRRIQKKAEAAVSDLQSSEINLIKTLQLVEDNMVHRWCGYNSLFEYAVQCLRLSRSQAYMYVGLAKATRKYSMLESALVEKRVTPSKAARVLFVIPADSEQQWVLKAAALPKAELEKEVAKINPKKVPGERSHYLTSDVIEMNTPVSEDVYKKLVRVQDLISSSTGQAESMETVFEKMADLFLQKNDPVEMAKRRQHIAGLSPQISRPAISANGDRLAIPKEIEHQVNLRDQRQCQHRYPSGQKCPFKRWLHLHHRVPVLQGGELSVENLITLCPAHHELAHLLMEEKNRNEGSLFEYSARAEI